ncbi:MAG: hypothetical protein COV34_01135 [Candidatus Zambryskibacteria bacterium CG10_big_fil_rev_8_21_14_0_10_42_12]|uniref:SHSP domain-containing protein n=1 Tax=Candidatus Zambryskibacteria bacterium CG10_big_fil_rev_8_21_14_0_10_42_12 TaxID=1975115 RepID=A0A2H0QWM0_9BACT|nr:MAG: hypothetical protein COV34_01135 [Candidatus Zambryskibacteria bacterium CG10_big_fil_rev_8_21_14_0_10_42_12]
MFRDRRSFFERLTGAVKVDDYEYEDPEEDEVEVVEEKPRRGRSKHLAVNTDDDWAATPAEEELESEGELAVDMHDAGDDLIIKTMVAGVKPEDLDVAITRDSVTIKGKREHERTAEDNHHIYKELYWGAFSRTISLPAEIDVEAAEAIEKHGLLVIKLPKIDKNRQTKLKVRGSA